MQLIDPSAEPRHYPSPIGPVGRAIALWAIICAVAATSAGGVVGYMLGFGVAMISTPLLLLGLPVSAIPTVLVGALCLIALSGAVQLVLGLRWEKLRLLAPGGVHLIGLSMAACLCLRAAEHLA